MANIRIPFLVFKRNKAGAVTSWHWQPSAALARANWRAVALGADEGIAMNKARDINAQVALWKTGGAKPKEVARVVKSETLGALIASYRLENYPVVGKKELIGKGRPVAASTRKTYETSLKRLELWAGDKPCSFITRDRVVALCRAIGDPDSPGFLGVDPAHKTLKMLRTLGVYGVRKGMWATNPADDVALPQPDPRDVIWSPPARDAMLAAADAAGRPSIALAILLGFAIAQREGDLLAMSHNRYVVIPAHKLQVEDAEWLIADARALGDDSGTIRGIRLKQNKTGAWVEVPLWGDVRKRVEGNIAAARKRGVTTILFDDERGTPYATEADQTRFQRSFAEIRTDATAAAIAANDKDLAAELPRLQFRDLRRTCVVWLGEHGFDPAAIASLTGHDLDETLRILKTYMPRTTGQSGRVVAELGRIEAARAARDEQRREAQG